MNKILPIYFVFLMLGFIDIANSAKDFRIYDATTYKNNDSQGGGIGIPNASTHGLDVIDVIYSSNIWRDTVNKMDFPPDNELVKKSLANFHKKKKLLNIEYLCIDIEHWSLNENDNYKLNKNIKNYIDTIKAYRKNLPGIKLGFYSMLPVRNYYDAIKDQNTFAYQNWKKQNDKLSSIANSVDVIFPSLYSFTSDRDSWIKYALQNIREAKRYGKPVYVFIWPQYHESAKFIGLDFLPANFWKLQLETAYKYADGVVIWGGWDVKNSKRLQWDEGAEWWVVTKEFVKEIQ